MGRDGGDEFIAILYGVDWDGAQDVLRSIRAQTAEYSRQHPEMPLRYAAGCAIASDFEGSTLRELFRHADKNMYVDKNRAKREEAEAQKLQDQQLLQGVTAHGYQFSDCLYCDACWTSIAPRAPRRASSLLTTAAIRVQWSRS